MRKTDVKDFPELEGAPELKASQQLEVRFSEVDSMGVVWHGSYAL